ncbi:efflux RND transporter periplasmic adaptor subunit [Rhizobium sp. L1K21]|uniref:efflux RND transporter periplasmic adaptor subunit n=1 Tax=Rhizobium sp. L1K21 TaxID=2954933 RepID=UPI00209225FE|nr:efflux RND transporter periplasmic adaptor subunit [Rhizobium sp. L1K21]MCO6186011.1 efflux RND transporter periplasmic adaptor subunit [Rhizobium sp. L1K21]
MKAYKVAGCLAGLVAFISLSSCEEQGDVLQEAKARPVLTATVKAFTPLPIAFPGTVEAQISTQKAFRVPGQVLARNVNTGDIVRKGDILAVLDTKQLELGVRSAEAAVASAKSQVTNAEAVAERARLLSEEGFASPAQLDTATENLKAANAQLESANAQLEKAREQMGYATLVADYDGIVTAVNIEIGETANAGAPAITIARLDLRDAVVDVPEDVQALIKPGDTFSVATVLQPDKAVTGTVREIAPDADKLTHTVRVKISLGDPPENFRIGTTVTVSATETLSEPSMIVPSNAILLENAKAFVWKLDEETGTVSKVPVDGEDRGKGYYQIFNGVHAGDAVAIAGIHSLTDGQKVSRLESLDQ